MPLTGKLCISATYFSAVLLLNTQAAGMVGFHVAEVLGQTLWLRNKLQSWQFSHEQNAGICPARKPAQPCLTWKTEQASQLLIQSSSSQIYQVIHSNRNSGADLSVQDA